MKKLTINALVFGPYNAVEVLADSYRCDGADLPFTVVGSDGVVTDWVGPLPVAPPVPPKVPESVTMRQARLALFAIGKLATVDTILNSLPEPQRTAAKIEWEFSSTVERHRPLVLTLGPALSLDAAALDTLFITAAGL